MEIRVNGAPMTLGDGATVQDLVVALELQSKPFAVEVNRVIVPRSKISERVLVERDQVEIVTVVGGG